MGPLSAAVSLFCPVAMHLSILFLVLLFLLVRQFVCAESPTHGFSLMFHLESGQQDSPDLAMTDTFASPASAK